MRSEENEGNQDGEGVRSSASVDFSVSIELMYTERES